MKETIKELLKFRSQFTTLEWFEINQTVEARLRQKADQLKLDDIDIDIMSNSLERSISRQVETNATYQNYISKYIRTRCATDSKKKPPCCIRRWNVFGRS